MTDEPAAPPTSSNASLWLMNLFGACIALAIVLWFFIPLMSWGGSDLPVITKRAEWPPSVEQLVQGAELAPETVAAIEVTPQPDGYFLRMPVTDAAVALVEGRFKPFDQTKKNDPRIAEAVGRFWDHLPHRWRNHKPRTEDRFFMNAGETITDVFRINGEDGMVLLWHNGQTAQP